MTQQHGGTITVESEVGVYTEFTITIPRVATAVSEITATNSSDQIIFTCPARLPQIALVLRTLVMCGWMCAVSSHMQVHGRI